MKTVFEVPGNPVGYYAVGARPNYDRKTSYYEYCKKVQLYALQAGLHLPLVASKERPLIVATLAYFQHGIHPDPENVRKGVCDALFYSSIKGAGDKYTAALALDPQYDADKPRVIVFVGDGEKELNFLRSFFVKVMVGSKR